MEQKNKKINDFFLYIYFFLFLFINLYLMIVHEPWRDEVRAWNMSKYLNLKDLIIVSRFDGHPILWHLILMPFSKLGFPLITANIISYIIVAISGWIFLFKTDLGPLNKIIILLTVPFIYVYSSFARNYTLIIIFAMMISAYYKKRYTHPIIYSLLICLLIHTHSLMWGVVAGLVITFHFVEIFKYLRTSREDRKNINIKPILIGLALIVINTILIVAELYGTSNRDYTGIFLTKEVKDLIVYIEVSLFITFLYTLIVIPKNIKEYFIVFFGLAFHVVVYKMIYGTIILQRLDMIYIIYLMFFILIASEQKYSKRLINSFGIIYIVFLVLFGGFYKTYKTALADAERPYSSAQEMAEFINNNLPDEDVILIDSVIICQTIEPYLKDKRLYDIVYNDYLENIKYMNFEGAKLMSEAFGDIEKYKGKYLISIIKKNVDLPIIYKTESSIMNEDYVLYYIN